MNARLKYGRKCSVVNHFSLSQTQNTKKGEGVKFQEVFRQEGKKRNTLSPHRQKNNVLLLENCNFIDVRTGDALQVL